MKLLGTYVSVWDKNVVIERDCMLEILDGPVAAVTFDPVGAFDEVEELTSETVKVQGLEFSVTTNEDGAIDIDNLPQVLTFLAHRMQHGWHATEEDGVDESSAPNASGH